MIACIILFLWRPIFLELGSAIHLNGGNYAYLLQVSGKTLGLIGAAATLLDSVATSTVSAATAASYKNLAGFETTPIYIESIRANIFPSVLRNILISTLVLNAPLILLVYAILPSEEILAGANILSVLAQSVAGRWLRVLVVVDCVFVLSGGVIDGICSGCALIDRLAR